MVRPLPCARLSGEQIRSRLHATADDHRLADPRILARQFSVPGGKGARGAFAMDQHRTRSTIHDVGLELRGIVGHVVGRPQTELEGVAAEHVAEHLANAMQDHLSIRQ
jgi:hypothetical protein